MKDSSKRYNIVMLPQSRTALLVGDLCSNDVHKAFIFTEDMLEKQVVGYVGSEYKYPKPQFLYAISDEAIKKGDSNFYFIELDLNGTRSKYANELHYCNVGVTDNFILTSTTNFPFPENCRKVVASNNIAVTPKSIIPESYIKYYANMAIDTGVPFDYIYLLTEEYPDINIGESLVVDNDFPNRNIKRGDFITVTDVEMDMVFYDKSEIHFSHLLCKTISKPLVDSEGFIDVDYCDEKNYNDKELSELMFSAVRKYYEMAIIDNQLKQRKAPTDLRKDFFKWFREL